MDWKALILDLRKGGMTQVEIGLVVGLSQPAVSDLSRGNTAEVTWSVGQRLIQLAAERLPGKSYALNVNQEAA